VLSFSSRARRDLGAFWKRYCIFGQEQCTVLHQTHSSTGRNSLSRSDEILLESTHEGALLGRGLEGTVAELGRGVDPLELDLLGRAAVGLGGERLAQGHDTLLDTGNRALDEQEVVLDLTIADETTHTGHMLAANSKTMVKK